VHAVSGDALQEVEKFKYLVIFASDKSQNKEIENMEW